MIAAAEQQLETAGGVEDTPFVTITVTIDAADSTKRIVSAYQVTDGPFDKMPCIISQTTQSPPFSLNEISVFSVM